MLTGTAKTESNNKLLVFHDCLLCHSEYATLKIEVVVSKNLLCYSIQLSLNFLKDAAFPHYHRHLRVRAKFVDQKFSFSTGEPVVHPW